MSSRYARNVGMLGATGQRRIEESAVAVVGLGGLGSHVAQQLAYLGTREFVLVDPDVIEESNLNRLIGAVPGDEGKPKVDVVERMIASINPEASVTTRRATVEDKDFRDLVVEVDCIFGCLDNDAGRLPLTKLSSRQRIAYFDLASDSGEQGSLWYGGRVFVSLGGNHCLSCAGELDQRALALSTMEPEQREADRRIYGVPSDELDGTGPMVVSINGVVASLAVTEFMAWVAGLRAPKPHLVYRGDLGMVTTRTDERRDSCYYCDVLYEEGG